MHIETLNFKPPIQRPTHTIDTCQYYDPLGYHPMHKTLPVRPQTLPLLLTQHNNDTDKITFFTYHISHRIIQIIESLTGAESQLLRWRSEIWLLVRMTLAACLDVLSFT